jgi:RNA polymerase sigma factor (sigma-70 family)
VTHVNGRIEPLEPEDAEDLLDRYLRQVGQTSLLTAEQEVELAKRIEAGVYASHLLEEDGRLSKARRRELRAVVDDGQAAKDHMVRANLRLVIAVAKRYPWSGLSFLDLIQEGNLGLIRAVEKFDFAKGYKFSTYAMWWIRQAIQRGIAASSRTVRLPAHVVEELNRIRARERELVTELGREPTVDEVAAAAGLSVERVDALRRAAWSTVSLDSPAGEGADASLGDLIADPRSDRAVESAEHRALAHDVREIVETLPPREALIVSLRFGLQGGRQHSIGEVAERLGLSPERIRQLEKQSLAELRDPARHHPLLAWAS